MKRPYEARSKYFQTWAVLWLKGVTQSAKGSYFVVELLPDKATNYFSLRIPGLCFTIAPVLACARVTAYACIL